MNGPTTHTLFRIVATVAFARAACLAETVPAQSANASPQFDQVRSLIGRWIGTSPDGARVSSTFRLVGGGSAILQTLSGDGVDDSVTIIYVAGGELRADHYCHWKNHSLLVANPSAYSGLICFIAQGTHAEPRRTRYHEALMLRFLDRDHHTQFWRAIDGNHNSRLVGTRFTRVP